MEDGNPRNLLQEKIVKDETNGELKEREEQALLFLDSLDCYLVLLESLTSTLRQGWLELAGARHSMGPSRISSTLLDLKVQSAVTKVIFNEPVEESPSVAQPQFRLSKWACLEERRSSSKEFVDGRSLFEDCISSQLTFRGPKHASVPSESAEVNENIRALSLSENSPTTSESTTVDVVNKKRYKSLSVFGALVSPKLRAAQFSFETALETIVEIANMQSSMISSSSRLQKYKNKCFD
ncbi:coiled-coil domain-containing protein 115 isoform X2 [Phalaenopsis equestris]|uniref:coiled-coil domain-containing protein 115 isoform X2 n=1 Tax=Phalaenopsis equestris TaxID=78828 RepID=UPI0009E60471|nr:coiled-coil domain-containing protein 115 isoform X2 [Phalaenopsis equestris]